MVNSQSKWLILIEEQEVVVCLLTASGSFFVGKNRDWNGLSFDDLVAALDASCGEALALAKEDRGPDQGILVLPPSWIDQQGEVLSGKKRFLKDVCASCQFTPLGFLVGEEVLANFFENFLSVYFGKDTTRLALVINREVAAKDYLEIGPEVSPEDLVATIRKMAGEKSVPPQIVFWGLTEKLNQQVVDYHWDKENVFESAPRVLNLSWEELFARLVQVVSDEVVLDDQDDDQKDNQTAVTALADDQSERLGESEPINEDKPKESIVKESGSDEKIDFGFSSNDVGKDKFNQLKKEPEVEPEPEEKIKADKSKAQEEPKPNFDIEAIEMNIPDFTDNKNNDSQVDFAKEHDADHIGFGADNLDSKAKISPKALMAKIGSSSKALISFVASKKAFLLLLIVPVLAIGGLLTGWYFSKASIEIYITPENLASEVQARMDPEAESLDIETGVIPVEEVSVTIEGKKTAATTGSKLVGEKAKGEVMLYNRTGEIKSFPAGTVLVGPGNLEFILDNDVQIASKTADLESTPPIDKWGETKAAITASEIGAEYNLEPETIFEFKEYDRADFLAKNLSSLTGGSSRQIRAVSSDDQESLLGSLQKELEEQAKNELLAQSNGGKILTESVRTVVVEEKYSAEVGDEVDTLTLTLSIKAIASRLEESNLLVLAQEALKKDVSDKLALKADSIDFDFKVDEADDDGLVLGVMSISGKAYPQLDTESLKALVAKKTEKEAEKLIRQQQRRIFRIETKFKPGFYKSFKFLPPKPENISIELKE